VKESLSNDAAPVAGFALDLTRLEEVRTRSFNDPGWSDAIRSFGIAWTDVSDHAKNAGEKRLWGSY
jgi:hypothetical protein